MTVVAPKIHPEDVRRTTCALIAALIEIVDGTLPAEPVDVDYILYKPKDTKYIKITVTQPTPQTFKVGYTMESGASRTYSWRKNQFGKWTQTVTAWLEVGNDWALTSMDEVRSLTHAVLVVRGLLRDSDE